LNGSIRQKIGQQIAGGARAIEGAQRVTGSVIGRIQTDLLEPLYVHYPELDDLGGLEQKWMKQDLEACHSQG
jgi:hypothetical protein